VPIQFSTYLKNAIMYAKHRIRPTCRRIGLKKVREMSFLPSSSTSVFLLPLNGLNTRCRQPQPPAAAQIARVGAARGSAHARRSSPVELASGGARTRGRAPPQRCLRARLTLRRTWPPHPPGAAYGEAAERGNSPRRPNPRPPLRHLQIVVVRTFHTL
jgi:hypothetical protein